MLESVVARTTEAGSRTLVAAIAAGEESCGSYMAGMSNCSRQNLGHLY